MAIVIAGAMPLIAGCYQFLLAGLNGFFGVWKREGVPERCRASRSSCPAWNEAAVIGRTLDTLMALDYPADRLRVYVVDDASTDETPDVVLAKAAEYPGRVFHVRREQGGEGKAHTINHGLRTIRAEDWYEAILIIDADVIFTRVAAQDGPPPRRSEVGAVTAYIKEGSRPANYMNRFIVVRVRRRAGGRPARAERARRAGLPGRRRAAAAAREPRGDRRRDRHLVARRGHLHDLQHPARRRRVVFEPHAIVWAEEPRDIDGLWKQRLRWGRGNVQVTLRYRRIWLRRGRGRARQHQLRADLVLGLPDAGVHGALVGGADRLWLLDRDVSIEAFRLLWSSTSSTYLFITLSSFARTARGAA